ncbi:unnamed protein product [Mytilus coruscus]|uniref:BIRC7_8 n=1 Tax=Mytilus coruscus TaxID=42192 RepID=A0A6J8F0Y5_MYTCO|nr:unnamed protein product [Mytilus coruscus]
MTDVNTFETTMRLASFQNWPDSSYSPVIIVRTGFSYTGNGFEVECEFCKAKVDMSRLNNNVISLADEHDSSCRRKTKPQDNFQIPVALNNVAGNAEEGTNTQNNHVSASSYNDDANFDRGNTAEQTAQDNSEHNCEESSSVDSTNIAPSFMPALPLNAGPEPRIPPTIVQLNERICSDLSLYDNYPSIKLAPSLCCPCRLCRYNNTIPIFRNRKKTDMYGLPKMDGRTLMFSLRERVSSGPLHPEFNTFEARERNLNGIIDSYSCIAEAGFFADRACSKERICCFYCDGNLKTQPLSYNPWREHTRWFPVCPFIIQQKGEEYIHNVLEDTKILKTYLEDKRRTSYMHTDIVIEALKVYPQYAIGKVIQGFFLENGYFPCREDLFESLDNFQLWKTSETYDYCRFEN